MNADTLTENCVALRVMSCADGSIRIEPYYDTARWCMEQEDGQWYGYPGVFTRLALAGDIAEILSAYLPCETWSGGDQWRVYENSCVQGD